MSINDIVVDFVATFGNRFLLADVKTRNVYKDGIKTDEIYYSYEVVCLDTNKDKISIKIPGAKLIDSPDKGDFVFVALENAIAKPYVVNNEIKFSITASNIKKIKRD